MTAAPAKPVRVLWRAQPGPQRALLSCPVFEVFYGGARGGGKTDGMLGEWAQHAQRFGRDAIGRFFRRERTQLMETVARAQELYVPLGAKWRESEKEFRFPNGARLVFSYLDNDSDAEAYQGHSYTRVYFEELTNFPSQAPVMKLMATLRSAKGVACRFRATGNPGGPGHGWVKARYIDPAPRGMQIIAGEGELDRVFIPARLSDNHALMDSDPSYIDRLRMAGSAELVRAWLDGDWTVVEGAFFDGWRSDLHVVPAAALPARWTRFRAMDWGSARPFSVGWYAISDGELAAFPRGALVRYREWYGCVANQPNVGLKLHAEAVAAGILERTPKGEEIAYTVCDPAMWQEDGGPSIAERMIRAKLVGLRHADNKRQPGWEQVRSRLAGDDGRPMLYVMDNCRHLIRTLPAMQHDEVRAEDLDTEAEDHAVDELRYACMSRPFLRAIEAPKPVRNPLQLRVLMEDLDRRAEDRSARL